MCFYNRGKNKNIGIFLLELITTNLLLLIFFLRQGLCAQNLFSILTTHVRPNALKEVVLGSHILYDDRNCQTIVGTIM